MPDESKSKPRGTYKSKNQLDGFLRFAIAGKYKWRRYEIFEEYLRKWHEPEAIKLLIQIYQQDGIPNKSYQGLLSGIQDWRKEMRIQRARKAAIKRHKNPTQKNTKKNP